MNLGIIIHLLPNNIADNSVGVKEVLRKQNLDGGKQGFLHCEPVEKLFLKWTLLSKKLIFQILSNLWPLHLQLIIIDVVVSDTNSYLTLPFALMSQYP